MDSYPRTDDDIKVSRLTNLSRGQYALDKEMYVNPRHTDFVSLNSSQKVVDHDTRTKLDKWFQPAKVAISQRDAENKCHPQTGLWLLEREEFIQWMYTRKSLLWLEGICQLVAHCANFYSPILSSGVREDHPKVFPTVFVR